eukprot:24421-Chlamydomonas_euryale.AAC.1
MAAAARACWRASIVELHGGSRKRSARAPPPAVKVGFPPMFTSAADPSARSHCVGPHSCIGRAPQAASRKAGTGCRTAAASQSSKGCSTGSSPRCNRQVWIVEALNVVLCGRQGPESQAFRSVLQGKSVKIQSTVEGCAFVCVCVCGQAERMFQADVCQADVSQADVYDRFPYSVA